MKEILLKVNSLTKYYPVKRGLLYKTIGWVKAVDGISLEIEKGKTLGLVGESGCGKTTLARTILRLVEANSGEIFFQEQEISHLSGRQMRRLRKEMQVVFQDPVDSLDPRFSAARIVGEGLEAFRLFGRRKLREKIRELLTMVGLPEDALNRYPHEFSGGQRQRLGIARAISLSPALLVLDEPVSSLDVSIQSQILNLLEDLQEELNLTYLFITHDLNVTRLLSDEVAVMYLGKIVEQAENADLFNRPLHPYTQALLEAIPITDPQERKEKKLLKGEVSSALSPPSGCRFRTRCPYVMDICAHQQPLLKEAGPSHSVACHLI